MYLESEAFSGANDLLTPTQKLKRMQARDRYAAIIQELYAKRDLQARLTEADTQVIYLPLRGITDLNVYSDAAPHADRPHEIFAEDFRALFGNAELAEQMRRFLLTATGGNSLFLQSMARNALSVAPPLGQA